MRIYDISLTISSDLPIWPGDPPIVLERIAKIKQGDAVNLTRLSMCAHSGTHIDAPFHFFDENAITIQDLPVSLLTGRVYVLHISDDVDLITEEVLQRSEIPPRTRRLLFKTRNSSLWEIGDGDFHQDYVALAPGAAQYLVDRGIKLVGIDYLSIAPFLDPTPTHQILLGAGVVVVEGLNLTDIPQGRYTLYCLPIKLAGADGAPARAILIGV
jgi:arylformamidase